MIPSFLDDLPLARRALHYARALHGEQRRVSDAAPFILHPLEVAALLFSTGHPEAVVAAAILHDTVEDTEAHIDDIAGRFGTEVAGLVATLTEDPCIGSYDERKAALREQVAALDRAATAIYAADKVTKVRELRAQAGRDPAVVNDEGGEGRQKLSHYVESLHTLEGLRPDHPLVRQLRFELEALDAFPPGGVRPPLQLDE